MSKVVFEKIAELIKEPFKPLDIFNINEVAIRLVKIHGKYHWHKHNEQDEIFIVLKGVLEINFKDDKIILNRNEAFLVKKGTLHQSFAAKEALVLIVEPQKIKHIGD